MTSSSKNRTLSITGDVFVWLYKTSGCTPDDISKNTNISESLFSKYLESKEDITLSLANIKALAEPYRRPITAFLVSSPPKNNEVPKDFRRRPANEKYSISLHRTFVKSNRSLKLFVEMSKNLGEASAPNLPHVTINDNPFETAESERKRFGVDEIKISKNEKEAYKQWREILASNYIPCFQYNMNEDGFAGLSRNTMIRWQ